MSADTLIEKHAEPRRDRLKLVDARLETAQPPSEARKPEEATPGSEQSTARPPAGRKPVKRMALILVAGTVLAAGGWFGLDWWRNGRFIVSTDDAYVGAEMA
ncbi:MAG: HlyD family secretion protein, partial [Bosea sp.]|nr:HlyD family secretion protein [Bosea sp. (in: a-proteobacteria)]